MSFKVIRNNFKGNLREVSKLFQGCFNIVFRMLQVRLKGVSMEF